MTKAERDILAAGYKEVYPVRIKFEKSVRWFETVDAAGDEVLLLRQGPNRWHAFFTFAGTASGDSPATATRGGLGDAIDSDSQLRSYCRMVLSAPRRLSQKYEGLYAAQGQCYQEFEQI